MNPPVHLSKTPVQSIHHISFQGDPIMACWTDRYKEKYGERWSFMIAAEWTLTRGTWTAGAHNGMEPRKQKYRTGQHKNKKTGQYDGMQPYDGKERVRQKQFGKNIPHLDSSFRA